MTNRRPDFAPLAAVLLLAVGVTGLPATAQASPDCLVDPLYGCSDDAACTINLGDCTGSATCLLNAGACSDDGACLANAGACDAGDTCPVDVAGCNGPCAVCFAVVAWSGPLAATETVTDEDDGNAVVCSEEVQAIAAIGQPGGAITYPGQDNCFLPEDFYTGPECSEGGTTWTCSYGFDCVDGAFREEGSSTLTITVASPTLAPGLHDGDVTFEFLTCEGLRETVTGDDWTVLVVA